MKNIFDQNRRLTADAAVILMVKYGWVLRDFNDDEFYTLVWWNRKCSCFHWSENGTYKGIYGGGNITATFFNMWPWFQIKSEKPRRWESLYAGKSHTPRGDLSITRLFTDYHGEDIFDKAPWHNDRATDDILNFVGNQISLENPDTANGYCYYKKHGSGCPDHKKGHCMPDSCRARSRWDGKVGEA